MSILAIALVHLAAVVSPGANFLVVSRNSLVYSRQSGQFTARGVALGSLFYITIGMLGFATVIAQSPLVFNVIKAAGSAYFFYTGGKTLASLRRESPVQTAGEASGGLTRREAFLSGLATALSNPTSALYFLSLFTTFVPTSEPGSVKALTGFVLVLISFTWYTILAAIFSNPRVRLVYRRFERPLTAWIGVLWIGLGIKLLMTAAP